MIKYGDKVIIRDGSRLDGCVGIVYKLVDDQQAHVLLDREVVWPIRIKDLEVMSDSAESGGG
ncbi:MAG: hypothetical protein C0614_02765 [Desulfuromonas sp.]|nr:MAG: hypothetical protein C0614_02765 [Desulfuromonas sp.]